MRSVAVAVMLLLMVAGTAANAQTRPTMRPDEALLHEQVKVCVRSAVAGLVNRDVDGLRRCAHIPMLLAISERGPAVTTVIDAERLRRSMRDVPPIPGGAQIAEEFDRLEVRMLGRSVAVAILHPRPAPQTGPRMGLTALVANPPREGWQVVAIIFGPATAPPAQATEAIESAVVGFWQALLAHNIGQLRQFVHLPYADVANEERGADVQVMTEALLRHLEAHTGGIDDDGGAGSTLVKDMQLRFYGESAAVGLYSSGFDVISETPQEAVMAVRGADGRWRILAMASD